MCKKLSPIRPTKHFPRLQVLKRWNRRKAQEGATLPFDSLNDDIFADIMLFAGTASVSSMAKTSKEMSLRCDSQQVWKKLCVATGKKGIDERPQDWNEYYRKNPMVPGDFSSVSMALTVNPDRVLLSQDDLYERSTIEISSRVIIEGRPVSRRDSVVLHVDTNSSNSPGICLVEGANVTLKNVELLHFSRGHDVWSGNSAVYSKVSVKLTVTESTISSRSGRGIHLARGTTQLLMEDSAVRACAATGIFLDATDLVVCMRNTEITGCGRGNHVYRGISAGHSGVYVQSGRLSMDSCLFRGNHGDDLSRSLSQSAAVEQIDTTFVPKPPPATTYFDTEEPEVLAFVERYF